LSVEDLRELVRHRLHLLRLGRSRVARTVLLAGSVQPNEPPPSSRSLCGLHTTVRLRRDFRGMPASNCGETAPERYGG
jgi:hypothetical protein